MERVIPCPACGKQVPLEGQQRPPEAPFCSKRCRLVDLGKWAEERYAVSRPLSYDDLDVLEEDR
jgi:endogenous inhibitor of DNA gyrase (YacG/DUF329 family)